MCARPITSHSSSMLSGLPTSRETRNIRRETRALDERLARQHVGGSLAGSQRSARAARASLRAQHQGGVADRRGSKAGVPGKRSGPFMQRMDQDRPDAGDLRRLKRCETGVASQRRAPPFALPGLVNGQPAALSAAARIGPLLRPAGGHQRGPVAGVRRGGPTPWPGVVQGRRAGRP